MDCRDVQGLVHAYVDGEFDEEERVAFSAHLASCPHCRNEARLDEALKRKIRQSVPAAAPLPSGLERRVRQGLAQAEGPRIVRQLRWLVPAAAAVLLVLGTAVTKRGDGGTEAALAEQSIEWHRLHLPLDVRGPSPDTVRSYFMDKVPFAVRPPSLPQAQLVGGRLANVKEHQAAYLLYQVNGRRVSVLVFDPSTLGAASREVRDPSIQWRHVRGYSVALFASGGTGYAVASDMEPDRMVKLISYPGP